MAEHVLFLTGSLASRRLERILHALSPSEVRYEAVSIGVKVASLMTGEIIRRRLHPPDTANRAILPGKAQVDLDALSRHFGIAFERGPDDLADLPAFLGHGGRAPDLSGHDVRIFAEIVDAPRLDIAAILERAASLRASGADVIDLGCLPDVPFPHLEAAVAALGAAGAAVSVDSGNPDELARAARAGADYLLSLTETTLGIAEEGRAVPVLIPAQPGDMASLTRAIEAMTARDRPFLVDPILDPIHFGFTASLLRYAELRARHPSVEILMGIGNLTELTDADTTGVNAVLMGIVSELEIRNVLVVRVSPHCRRAVEEIDAARRMFFAAREAESLPSGFSDALMSLRDRRPVTSTPREIAELAGEIRDENYRIETSTDGIHLYNQRAHHIGEGAFALYPKIDVRGDAGHAFYLGYELAKAEIAWRLGKRYVQDRDLAWGIAVDPPAEPAGQVPARGVTFAGRGAEGKDTSS